VAVAAQQLADEPSDGPALLRNEPVQARSTARLAALLDSAAAVIDEIGYERMTTAMVAERAGASIGTVYRYFPDRIVVLQGLSARFLAQYTHRIHQTVIDTRHDSWLDAVAACVDDIVLAFRTEPGFRSLRFGDVLDIAPGPGSRSGNATIAGLMADALRDRFELEGADVAFHLEVALSLTDALLARAFSASRKGDDRFITEAKSVARTYLVGIYGSPA
jgi:AcrR family transcriptional regulator